MVTANPKARASEPGGHATVTGIPMNSTPLEKPERTPPLPANPQSEVPWSTGLCDFCSDYNSCCLTFWCPCITFGRISEIVDKGSSSCGQNGGRYYFITQTTGFPCLYSWLYRSKMRQQYSIQGSRCGDCCIHFFCEACALCQEYRELQNHGFDMTIRWHGNMEQNQEIATPPVVQGGMTR